MRMVLQRHHIVKDVQKNGLPPKEDAAIGIATIYDNKEKPIFYCFTIENGKDPNDLENPDRRILPGEYKLEWSRTKVSLPDGYTEGLKVTKEEKRTFKRKRIFMHVGNFPHDAKGCILINGLYNIALRPGYGKNSMDTTKVFYDIMKRIDLSLFTLEIKEIQNDHL